MPTQPNNRVLYQEGGGNHVMTMCFLPKPGLTSYGAIAGPRDWYPDAPDELKALIDSLRRRFSVLMADLQLGANLARLIVSGAPPNDEQRFYQACRDSVHLLTGFPAEPKPTFRSAAKRPDRPQQLHLPFRGRLGFKDIMSTGEYVWLHQPTPVTAG